MSVNVSYLFAATLRGQDSTNDYTNRVFLAQVGLARRPPNVVGQIGLSNVILPPFGKSIIP